MSCKIVDSLVFNFTQCSLNERVEKKEEKKERASNERKTSVASAAVFDCKHHPEEVNPKGKKELFAQLGRLERVEIQEGLAALEELFETRFLHSTITNACNTLQKRLLSALKTMHAKLQNEIALRRWNGAIIDGFAKIRKLNSALQELEYYMRALDQVSKRVIQVIDPRIQNLSPMLFKVGIDIKTITYQKIQLLVTTYLQSSRGSPFVDHLKLFLRNYSHTLSEAMDRIINCLMINKIQAAQLHMRCVERDFPNAADAIFQVVKRQLTDCRLNARVELFEACFTSTEDVWIKEAIQEGESLDFLEEALGRDCPTLKRYRQIHSGLKSREFENPHPCEITRGQMMGLALFIEEMKAHALCLKTYFTPATARIARDVHFNWDAREIYIIAHSDASALKKSGSYKLVRSAVALSLDIYSLVEHVVQLSPNFAGKSKGYIEGIECEFPFYERLRGVPGFAYPLSYTRFTRADGKASASLITRRASCGNLNDCLARITEPNRIKIGVQVIEALAEMHRREIYHGDLKLENILVYDNNQIFITDFGFSFFLDSRQRKWTVHPNFYPAYWDTPPELLRRDPALPGLDRNPQVTVQQLKKIEEWVAGCLLYRIVNDATKWENTIREKEYPPQFSDDEKKEIETQHAESEIFLPGLDSAAPHIRRERDHYFLAALHLMRDEKYGMRWTLKMANDYLQMYLTGLPRQ